MTGPVPIHEAGTVLKQTYEVQQLHARGGMSRVYRAVRRTDNRVVAVKELFLEDMAPERREQTLRQFEQEGSLLRGLTHPGLVPVLDCFIEADRRYIVMELLEGEPLGRRLTREQAPASVSEVLNWIDQVCGVLIYLHSQDPIVVLRDLHPGNIILAPDGRRITIIDFGIAKAMDKATILRGVGTPGFAPLEQSGAGAIDQRADVYALGATLYALLTHAIPVDAQSRLFDDPLEPPSTLNPAIPPGLNDLVLRLMSRSKFERPTSVQEIRVSLQDVQAQLKPEAPPAGTPAALARRGCLPALLFWFLSAPWR